MAAADELLDQFCAITGADRNLASNLLEACGNNLEMAINMHIENGDDGGGGASVPPPAAASNSSASQPVAGPSRQQFIGAGLDGVDDSVRAPIPQKQETLIQPGFEGYQMNNRVIRAATQRRVRSVFDGFRNFEAETRRLEESDEPVYQHPPGYSASKKRTLEELFKPPLDIMFQGDWQATRDHASMTGRWLLVNIQDPKEFQCQVLNRDLWSNPGVKTIIAEHFVFWQQYKESDEAERYMTFYKINQWPYIAIIDPRTGENMVTWSNIDAGGFPELMTEFLSLHPSLESPMREPPRKRMRTEGGGESGQIAEMDEEAQLAAAIRASLAETLEQAKQDNEDSNLSFEHSDDETDGQDKPTTNGTSNGHSNHHSTTNGGDNNDRLSPPTTKREETGAAAQEESWETFLGRGKDDPLTNIVIRYPNGSRDSWKQPATSKLKALVLFVSSQGYSLTDHEIVTNFPRKIITQLDMDQTLLQLKLYPQETVFVQLKD